jgi:hypothetical protein
LLLVTPTDFLACLQFKNPAFVFAFAFAFCLFTAGTQGAPCSGTRIALHTSKESFFFVWGRSGGGTLLKRGRGCCLPPPVYNGARFWCASLPFSTAMMTDICIAVSSTSVFSKEV